MNQQKLGDDTNKDQIMSEEYQQEVIEQNNLNNDLQEQDNLPDLNLEVKLLIDNLIQSSNDQKCYLELKQYISNNKPSYQVEYIINCKSVYYALQVCLSQGEQIQALFLKNLKQIFQQSVKNKVQRIFSRSVLGYLLDQQTSLNFDYKRYQDEKIQDLWNTIYSEDIPNFIMLFRLEVLITETDFKLFSGKLVKSKKFDEAINFLSALKRPLKEIYDVVEIMNTNYDCQKAAEIIKRMKYPFSDFPQIGQRLDKKCVRYLENEFPWFKCEEMVSEYQNLLVYIVEDFYFKGKKDEAISIVERHKLLDQITKKDIQEQIQQDMSNNHFQYMHNILFTQDAFVPTDWIINDNNQEYLTNEELGVDEINTFFIQSDESEQYQRVEKVLLFSTITGIDSEFTSPFTKFDQNGVILQILQISTGQENYIFDIKSLKKSQKFKTLIQNYFETHTILKLGHSVKDDIILICKTLELKNIIVRNVIDISSVFKQISTDSKQSSLAFITETYMKKKLSKVDQCSNWNLRPLRKAQLHYAALDALICIRLYEIMMKKEENIELIKAECENFQI